MDRRTVLARMAATGGAVGLAGCGAIVGGTGLDEDEFDVGMTHTSFRPKEYTVAAGDTVVWGNRGSRKHTVTACGTDVEDTVGYCSGTGIPPDAEYFASGGYGSEPAAYDAWPGGGGIPAGDTYAHTFELPGEYPYYCIPHEPMGMVGTIVVTE